ncbi:VOC family protein [Lentzea sp. NPDC051213]|uniref:VOC family protein n=1 Tax=Lentzea sp. NPDC051213 TaxID=3364126 RepID=UPI0037B50422
MRIDHVILGARTIEPLRELLWERHGFGITDGSPNPDGTASWVVPFDTADVQYLELLVVHDEKALAESEFGEVFLDRTADGPAFLNWAVLVDDIVSISSRVEELTGMDPDMFSGESVRADGQVVPWAEAAFKLSWESRVLPFFLRYGNAEARADRVPGDLAAAGHKVRPTAITGVRLGSADAHGAWLADWPSLDALPVQLDPAAGVGVTGVQLSTEDGPLLLERL